MKFQFTVGDEEYIIWTWKGDYVNLGAGAETGLYREGIGEHWFTAKDEGMRLPMTLTLTDKQGNQYFDYRPSENQWRITGFDPSHPDMESNELTATTTIDFTGHDEMWGSFIKKWDPEIRESSPWHLDPTNHTATLRW
jgi:hypothetical protein